MSTKKKILIGSLAFLGFLMVSGTAFVFAILNRVSYVSVEEAALLAQEQQQLFEAAVAMGEVEEEPAVLQSSELNLFEEVEQTELSADEIAALEIQKNMDDVVNILLVGVDRRGESEMSRSDTIMIATLDKRNGRLKLTSIMRDLYVPIPGYGENRINSACVKGGPGLLMETINKNFQLDLQKYALVDFRMFQAIVDQLDGVTIEMSRSEVSEANDCIAGLNKQWKQPLRDGFITQRGGVIELTGIQALGYARARHTAGGDYSRTSRQYKVIQAIFQKFLASDLAAQTQLLYNLLPMVETNLETPEILALVSSTLMLDQNNIMHYRLPVEKMYRQRSVRGMWVLLPDIAANAKQLHWFLFDAAEVEPLEGSDTATGGKLESIPQGTEVPAESAAPEATVDTSATPAPDIIESVAVPAAAQGYETDAASIEVPVETPSITIPDEVQVPAQEAVGIDIPVE